MTPAARVAAAITLLDAFARPGETAMLDALLTRWARNNRYAGSKDRAAIADLAYGALRRWRSAGAGPGTAGRAAMLGSLRADGCDAAAIEALFSGARYAPAPLAAAERAWLSAPAPRGAEDWPDWLRAALDASVPDAAAEIAAQTERAPVDLRVNARKAEPGAAQSRLAEEGVETEAAPLSPAGLRLRGAARADRTACFADGWIEIQDASSQAAAALAAAAAGAAMRETGAGRVLDLCAGAGGKTLAMAALLEGARWVAHDVAPRRMADLAPRAARAGIRVETVATGDLGALAEACALTLVDAPCSGSGAWARRPDAKWRLTPAELSRLQAAQQEALALAAPTVAPGGALIYATCSLLASENQEATRRFLARDARFAPADLAGPWVAAGLIGSAPAGWEAWFSPARTGSDGFYVAALVRVR